MTHLDAETLAAFAEGKLKRNEIAAVVSHLDGCKSCVAAIEVAVEVTGAQPRSFRGWWVAAAAVIAAIGVTVPLVLRNAPTQRLVRLAPRDTRVVEPRLSGGFAWAPYRGPMRATSEAANVERFKLMGETASLIEAANAKKTPSAQHAAGVALLMVDRPGEAIERLRAAAQNDAPAWNDLAAAEYAAALREGRPSLYPEALADVDHALRIDGNLPEALFNRALILERIGLTQQARDAWDRALKVDGTSPWAGEARHHLARLPAKTSAALDEHELYDAAARGDQKTVDAIVDRNRQQSRAAAETDYLGRWGMAYSSGGQAPRLSGVSVDLDRRGRLSSTGPDNDLAVARAVGNALVRISGESLLHDAVDAIDRAPPSQRATIAEAHAMYRRGRLAYSEHRVAEAEPDLRRAAQLFESVHDPMSLAARYYAANTRFDQNDARVANAELDQLRRDADAHPNYPALGAQVRWELMLCAIYDRDWNRVAAIASQAMTAFRRIGEDRNLAVIQGMRADALLFLGRPDDAWSERIASFATLTGEGRRLPIAIGDAANVEIATGRLRSGRALLGIAEEAAGRDDDAWLTFILARDAMTAAKLGERDEASRAATQARLVANRVADPALRARALADAQLAAGAIETNPRLAVAELTRAVDAYAAIAAPLLVVEAKLLRARAEIDAGDRRAASRDVDDGIALAEKQPIRGTFVDDAGRELFSEAIGLALDRGDTAAAFSYAERSRDPHAVDVAAIRQRLHGSGAAIIEVASHAVFCLTESSIDAAPLDASGDPYETVVRPFEQQLAHARQLIVVAGGTPLQNVSFAALYDAKQQRHLIEEMPVSMAESASSLDVSSPVAPRSVVALALPSGGGIAALPESAPEVDDIERLYPQALKRDALTRADVIHISGHTEQLAGDDALIFGDARVSGSVASSMSIGHPIVVLAACETLRASPAARARTLSVGAGFLAAGATAVVGTLEPIADNEAREIFREIHRGLAAGEPPAIAVQRAQIDALARHSNAWRAVTLLVSRISNAG
jgi:tetratricopeptide (TPR) repeat protein